MHGLSASHARVRPVVLIAILALVAALVPIVPVAAAPIRAQVVPEGDVIYVDNSVDGPGTGSAEDPFALLGDGLAAADAGDTVMVAPGEYGPYTGETLPFVVPSDVSVIGTYAEGIGWQTILSGGLSMTEPAAQIAPDTQIMVLGDRVDTFDARVTEVVGEGVEGVTLANLLFASNLFGDAGAGLGVYNSQVDIDNCAFTELIADLGSAIDAHNSDVSVSRSIFVGNGGGNSAPLLAQQEIPFDIDMDSLRLDQIPAGVDGASAQFTQTASYGGAIWSVDTDLDMRDCVLFANYAYTSGGAILIDGGTCTTTDSVFFLNGTAGGFIDSAEFRGTELDDYAEILASQFLDPFGGGAVSNLTGTYIAKRSFFVLNQSNQGAAVMTQAGSTKLDQCGIGMNWGTAVVSVAEGLLLGSADAGYRAAIALPEPTDYPTGLDIDRCQIILNDGVFTVYSESHPTRVTNSLFSENGAMAVVAIEAGGLALNDVTFQPAESINSSVEGCTMVGNSVEYATVVGPIQDYTSLVNTILWDNDEWDPFADASNVDAFNVCYQGELDSGFEVDCFSDDPMLQSDLSLAEGSPCIDAGTSSPEYVAEAAGEPGLAWDLRPWDLYNLSRPLDGDGDGEAAYDIGAIELLIDGRVSGLDRFATSVEVSKQHFGTADTVVIATGREFADGLSGSGLAGVYYAPILLTEPGALPADVAAEITRLGATRAFILGGPAAVGPAVESALVGLGLEIERIGGIDRYETAALIADHVMEHRDGLMFFTEPLSEAFIARGDLFADALAVAPVAYANRMPVLLVQPDALPAHTVDVLGEYGITSAVVLGGNIAVSGAVAAEVRALDVTVTRIDGANRYETAANIAEWAWENYLAGFATTGIATGDDFADALSGGAGIGSRNGVLLLNPSTSVNVACESAIEDHADEIVALQILGGPAALSGSVYDYLMGLLAP
ncbi:MAG: cell wall-binding repeat-containing protein [Coriobacteriia bacterium]|nr:cell wall-binding repeat-containing protein [Coriobacteriia bacterium]